MKTRNIISTLAATAFAFFLTGCEGEQEPVIIEGDLPIKTSCLFMVGDATPNGWNIDNPTPLEASADDALVFSWEGSLYKGEIKLCLTTGSWDAPFIRPEVGGTEISKTDITDQKFIMHSGDPDNKWRVAYAGKYRLTFNLRNWTMSTQFLGENDAPVVEAIESDVLYMLGDATPNGWSMDNATQFTKSATDPYVFTWEGELVQGDMKACIVKDGSFSCPFLRPAADNVDITSEGVSSPDFVFTTSPDDKWHVKEAGRYLITFNLKEWTITVNKK